MKELKGTYNQDCKIFTDNIEPEALGMIQNILDEEVSATVPIRIMPDVHAGNDIVIGFTMPLTDRVNPQHIGVDIGCGVMSAIINKSDMSLSEINETIISLIPMGFSHSKVAYDFDFKKSLLHDVKKICDKINLNINNVSKQIGTLGGGNHFIEIGEYNDKWMLSIHCGSRNFGWQVCNYHVKKAKSKDSKYLFDEDMKEYLYDMKIAQEFANLNRKVILKTIIKNISKDCKNYNIIDSVHNYIDNNNIIRKGAISANVDEILVIPMNMKDGILLCKGKGNPDWNFSAPHGAGRIYGRKKAKVELSMDEFNKQMDGVYSTCICENTLDESPMAYKNMNEIINAIEDSVEILHIIKPILNIKSS